MMRLMLQCHGRLVPHLGIARSKVAKPSRLSSSLRIWKGQDTVFRRNTTTSSGGPPSNSSQFQEGSESDKQTKQVSLPPTDLLQ